MKRFFFITMVALCYQIVAAKSVSDVDRITTLEERSSVLQGKQEKADERLKTLAEELEDSERKVGLLEDENEVMQQAIDSLQNVCKNLENVQSADRKNINGKIGATDSTVRANQDTLQSRTLWGVMIVVAFLALVVVVAYRLTKRIKSGDTSIHEVRKAQEALLSAQNKMQEESVRLDKQLLTLIQEQITKQPSPSGTSTGETDHSLALKVADEIVRIELNMSRMDHAVKGYKQLAKAVERIKDNFKANGYEIIDMLGKPYNEGMKVIANFVADEDLEEGKQIITGVTKPQINYNGQMIQAAQVTVSQNI